MRTLLILSLLVIEIHNCPAQGTVFFANDGGSLVRDGRTGDPIPTGSSFLAALDHADDGVFDEFRYVQVGQAVQFGPLPGIFAGGDRTVPTPVPGGWGMFQVRVWEASFGATYEESLTAPPREGRFAQVGKSNIIRVDTGDAGPGVPPPAPKLTQWGLTGFAVTPVPEPSSLLLVGLGVVLLAVARFPS